MREPFSVPLEDFAFGKIWRIYWQEGIFAFIGNTYHIRQILDERKRTDGYEMETAVQG